MTTNRLHQENVAPLQTTHTQALSAEEEILKYFVAFEPLLQAKDVRYEWSFTDYHHVDAPKDGFRSIVEYVLSRATSSAFVPDYILIISNSFEDEMLIEFELSHRVEDIDEYYFQKFDIEILNRIYAHCGWHFSFYATEVSSIFKWQISKFSVLERHLVLEAKRLKPTYLSLASIKQVPDTKEASIAKLGLINLSNTTTKRFELILSRHFNVLTVDYDFDNQHITLEDLDFDILVLVGSSSKLLKLFQKLDSQSKNTKVLSALVSDLTIEGKLTLIDAGASMVLKDNISSQILLDSLYDSGAKFSLYKNARSGRVERNPSVLKASRPSPMIDLVQLINEHVKKRFDDARFDAQKLAEELNKSLDLLDQALNERVLHTCEQYIESFRLSEAYDQIKKRKYHKDMYKHCGFKSFS